MCLPLLPEHNKLGKVLGCCPVGTAPLSAHSPSDPSFALHRSLGMSLLHLLTTLRFPGPRCWGEVHTYQSHWLKWASTPSNDCKDAKKLSHPVIVSRVTLKNTKHTITIWPSICATDYHSSQINEG